MDGGKVPLTDSTSRQVIQRVDLGPGTGALEARWTRVASRPLVGVEVLDFGWAVQRVAETLARLAPGAVPIVHKVSVVAELLAHRVAVPGDEHP